ncbi:snaclec purpureotin subunit beta-like [Syngnathus typhle]|uniref:snaclec purpureotin subunit beta-like n=1 Tax=Syngnathus typhle TaxID=161592 RepID=UPI002A6A6972|nr:snaclec purpureotin subunit beta-like [Syngnathus typhle]
MAFALRLTFLLCGISGLLTGVWSFPKFRSTGNDCPKGWTQLDCNCYIYQYDERTFGDAESVCNILGGNLVSIHNALENAFVLELIRAGGNNDFAWIGLTDAIEEDDFMWTDGSEQDFLNFDDYAESSAASNCVAINENDGLWYDEDCTDDEPYVCIRELFSLIHH